MFAVGHQLGRCKVISNEELTSHEHLIQLSLRSSSEKLEVILIVYNHKDIGI